jgi:copper oxidase (laccase) domain-containing protein
VENGWELRRSIYLPGEFFDYTIGGHMTPIFYSSWGKERGNFNPEQDPAALLDLINDNRGKNEIKLFLAPRCAFTNKIVSRGEDDDKWVDWFYRTKSPADGAIVISPKEAVMIFNADCPIVAILDENAGRLAVLHAGFRCLVPAPRKGADTRSIIRVAFEDHHFKPNEVCVFVGFGIGPCCYGAEHWPELAVTSAMDLPIGRATRGPRAGRRSVDLYALIRNQLFKIGVPAKKIEMDYSCTACARHSGYNNNHYWSNCWDGRACGRNATFAWFR